VFSTEIRKADWGETTSSKQSVRLYKFLFSPADTSAEFPCCEAAFVVNSKPHTGPRPSVRVCVELISPTHKRTEGCAPLWGSEFTIKVAITQGDSVEIAATLNVKLRDSVR